MHVILWYRNFASYHHVWVAGRLIYTSLGIFFFYTLLDSNILFMQAEDIAFLKKKIIQVMLK